MRGAGEAVGQEAGGACGHSLTLALYLSPDNYEEDAERMTGPFGRFGCLRRLNRTNVQCGHCTVTQV